MKTILITIAAIFMLSGCAFKPVMIDNTQKDVDYEKVNKGYKVSTVKVGIEDNSKNLISHKFNGFGMEYQLRAKRLNAKIMESVFTQYFNTVNESKDNELNIMTSVDSFELTLDRGLTRAMANVNMSAKIMYKDKILLEKQYNNKEIKYVISAAADRTFKFYHKLVMNSIKDTYEKQIIPDLIKELNGE